MPKRKDTPEYARVGRKDHWHPYNLQSLSPNKFASVVDRILNGRFNLVTPRTPRHLSR